MRMLDVPPVWLAGFILATWALGEAAPKLTLGIAWQGWIAAPLFLAGALLIGLAVWQMTKARTTLDPHGAPQALVSDGVFRISRNPIYLGDMLLLAAFIAWWGVILALPGLWLFKRVIERRFIAPEEERLKAAFGDGYSDWASVTRRWV